MKSLYGDIYKINVLHYLKKQSVDQSAVHFKNHKNNIMIKQYRHTNPNTTVYWNAFQQNGWLHFISIVTLDILLTIINFSTTCQLSVIRVLVGCSRLSDC